MIYDLDNHTRRRSTSWQQVAARRQRTADLLVVAGLIAILLVGLAFRAMNLRGWDGLNFLHPDERFVAMTVERLQLPGSLREYLDTAVSPLNPRNYEGSRFFVYGTLPMTLTRLAVAVSGAFGLSEIIVAGRALSAIFDLVACLALFFLGRRVYGRAAGLLAAALYAVTVMPIQQAHFFTTDNFGVAFTTLALLFTTRLALDGRWRDAVWTGLFLGAAVASKVNLAAFAAIVALAALQAGVRRREPADGETAAGVAMLAASRWMRAAGLLAIAGLVSFVCFRVFQPDAFAGPHIWNIRLDPRFMDNLREVRGYVSGAVDFPPSHQWANRTPYVFALENMILWGMGLPLGLAAWAGFAAAGWRLLRPRGGVLGALAALRAPYLIPWAWVLLYFAWQGGGFNPSLRYFLPIYPPLILFAAWASLELGRWISQRRAWYPLGGAECRTEDTRSRLRLRPQLYAQTLKRSNAQRSVALCALLLLAATTSWAWAFTRIYSRPHTRIAAGEWMLQHAPRGSLLTTEQWDDALPFTNGNGNGCDPFCLIETLPYAEDEPAKWFGQPNPVAQTDISSLPTSSDGMLAQISQADYIVLSSARVYSSVARLPHRFPATLNYYRSLFDGSLGYDLVADFHSFPTLFGLPIPDLSSEEQFTVYDHPRVLIFRRTERFDPARAREIITGGVVWDEIYKISALTTSSAPTALRMPEPSWERLQTADPPKR
jgi:4-amino-4-deoxy-L-arabinose transferase-like glycosyltransferase